MLVVVQRLYEENATVKAILIAMISDDEMVLTSRLDRARLPYAVAGRIAPHLRNAPTRGWRAIDHVAELLGDSVAVVESAYSHLLRPKHVVTSLVAGLLGES